MVSKAASIAIRFATDQRILSGFRISGGQSVPPDCPSDSVVGFAPSQAAISAIFIFQLRDLPKSPFSPINFPEIRQAAAFVAAEVVLVMATNGMSSDLPKRFVVAALSFAGWIAICWLRSNPKSPPLAFCASTTPSE
ncbi:hypothetical protein HDF16_005827 [Granulicella aggregans]|uniref:Uncharacterized protein n=1 Tax=Granulicella aggregans TaxID=474949 RepID=A0A7W7ZKX2_9BACT|nr:hypothetical protein [Granulicella aggregans]MBB5061091.1 hypothetical protein [Granulicella aggregans]